MDLGAVLLLVALLIAVGLYLAAPLLGRSRRPVAEETLEASSLMAERDRVIAALQELDFDYKLGKVPPEDYPAQRSSLLEKGAEVLRQLDALLPAARAVPGERPDLSSRIEQAAAAGRADGASTPHGLADDRIESLLAARRAVRRAKSAGFCPRCGKPVLVTDEFCPHCGKRLKSK
jgi:hypothetical protein